MGGGGFTEENKAIYTAEEALEMDREFVNLMTPLWFKEVGLPEEALQVINWRVTGVSGQRHQPIIFLFQ